MTGSWARLRPDACVPMGARAYAAVAYRPAASLLLLRGRFHVDAADSRCGGPAAVASDLARLPCRSPAAQQGVPLSARPTEGRGDHRRDAPGGRVRSRAPTACLDRRALAGRAPHRRGDGTDRTGP